LFRSEGQILGFNRQETGYKSYETLFPKSVTDLNNSNCETAGILGAMAGIVGAMMAIEAIKQLLDKPDKLTNEILIYRQNGPQIFRIKI
jgi:adenylyltransferase/sulfurtransferase